MCIKSDFEEIILKLATCGQREKRSFCCHKIAVPNGLSAPAWGYINVKKIKNGKKSDFKEICFKLATNWQSNKEFLLTSKFCPRRGCLSLPRAIFMYELI